jgi:hypothetical protein
MGQGSERPQVDLGFCVLQLVHTLGEAHRKVLDEIGYLGIFGSA